MPVDRYDASTKFEVLDDRKTLQDLRRGYAEARSKVGSERIRAIERGIVSEYRDHVLRLSNSSFTTHVRFHISSPTRSMLVFLLD